MTSPDGPHPDRPSPPGLVLVLDANDAPRLADFWAAVLRYDRRGSIGPFEVLVPPEGSETPTLLIQAVDDAKLGKNRMHVDLHVADPESEAERLTALGATRLGEGRLDEIRWIVMADPEGNEFDVAWD